MIVSLAPGGCTSAMRMHMLFNRSSANSSALSGRIPNTLYTLFADLNGNAGRHISTCVPAMTNSSMTDKKLGLPVASCTMKLLNLLRAYSKIIFKILLEVSVTSIVVSKAGARSLSCRASSTGSFVV